MKVPPTSGVHPHFRLTPSPCWNYPPKISVAPKVLLEGLEPFQRNVFGRAPILPCKGPPTSDTHLHFQLRPTPSLERHQYFQNHAHLFSVLHHFHLSPRASLEGLESFPKVRLTISDGLPHFQLIFKACSEGRQSFHARARRHPKSNTTSNPQPTLHFTISDVLLDFQLASQKIRLTRALLEGFGSFQSMAGRIGPLPSTSLVNVRWSPPLPTWTPSLELSSYPSYTHLSPRSTPTSNFQPYPRWKDTDPPKYVLRFPLLASYPTSTSQTNHHLRRSI